MKRLGTFVLGLSLLAGPVLAFGPENAVAYRDPRLPGFQAAVDAAQKSLDAARLGLSFKVSTPDAVGYDFAKAARGEPGAVGTINGEASWFVDPENVGNAQLGYERSREDFLRAARESVRDALVTHARLWRAQIQLSQAQAAVRFEQLRLADLQNQLRQNQNNVTQADVQRQQLAIPRAQADLAFAQASLAQLQNDARRYGLSGEAEFRTVRFVIPQARLENYPSYRTALADLQTVQGQAQKENIPFLDQLTLGFSYEVPQVQFGVGFGLNQGIPQINGNAKAKINNNVSATTLTLSAQIPLGPSEFAKADTARANLALRQANLAQVQAGYTERVNALRALITSLEQRIQAGQAAANAEQQSIRELEARFRAGQASEQDYVQRVKDDFSLFGVTFAWEEYIQRVNEYLELAGGTFQIRQ